MSKVLPDSMLRRMSAQDRKAIGQCTAEEAAERYSVTSEREQHGIYINWLNQQDWFLASGVCFHDDPTRRRTGHKGDPDFQVCFMGHSLFHEFKGPDGRLSEDQKQCHIRLIRAGFYVHKPRSAAEAIVITKQWVNQLRWRATKMEAAAKAGAEPVRKDIDTWEG